MSRFKIKGEHVGQNGVVPIIGQGPSEKELQQGRVQKSTDAVIAVVAAGTHQIAEGIDVLTSAIGNLLAQMSPEDEAAAKATIDRAIAPGALNVYRVVAPQIREMLGKREANA